jgi:hypothetical protein
VFSSDWNILGIPTPTWCKKKKAKWTDRRSPKKRKKEFLRLFGLSRCWYSDPTQVSISPATATLQMSFNFNFGASAQAGATPAPAPALNFGFGSSAPAPASTFSLPTTSITGKPSSPAPAAGPPTVPAFSFTPAPAAPLSASSGFGGSTPAPASTFSFSTTTTIGKSSSQAPAAGPPPAPAFSFTPAPDAPLSASSGFGSQAFGASAFCAPAFGAFGCKNPPAPKTGIHEPTEELRWNIKNVKIYEWSKQDENATLLCGNAQLEGLVCNNRIGFRLLGSQENNIYVNHLITVAGSAPPLPTDPKPYYGVDNPELSRAKSAWDFAATGEALEKTFIFEFSTKAEFDQFETHHNKARMFSDLKEKFRHRYAKKFDELSAVKDASLAGQTKEDYVNGKIQKNFQSPELKGKEDEFYHKMMSKRK